MRRRFLRIAGGAALLAVTGCGIGADNTPRDIRPDLQPSDSAVPEPAPGGSNGPGMRIWFVEPRATGQASVLHPVSRRVDGTPIAVFDALIAGVTSDERDAQLASAIPRTLEVTRAGISSAGVLSIAISDDLLTLQGEVLIDAMAQLVFTGSELPGVTAVQVLLDGQPHEWPRGNESLTSDPLTTFDFPERDPTSQPDYPSVPSPSTTVGDPAATTTPSG